MPDARVGLLGASSFVGRCVIDLLVTESKSVAAISRKTREDDRHLVSWYSSQRLPEEEKITDWICVAPIWILLEYFDYLGSIGATRVVALSSTSRFTKSGSSSEQEQLLADKLLQSEQAFKQWAESNGIEWLILRPTMIYGQGKDKNVSEIMHMIRRYRFFPLLGKAEGLRQPIHVADVALASVMALNHRELKLGEFNISGAEVLSYREMISRIFKVLGYKERVVTIPLSIFALVIRVLRLLPRYRHWTGAMAQRMNQDLVFDHSDAAEKFGFRPRAFELKQEDIPTK